MDIFTSLVIVAIAALVHASFQLSVSVLTLLGSHVIGSKRSKGKLLRLTSSYVAGAGTMTILLLSFASLVFLHAFGVQVPLLAWAIVCGVVFGIGVAIWLFYYRKEQGTSLWIGRSFAHHLSDRSKQTESSAEAFSLGLTTVASELIFILPSMALSALVLLSLPGEWQLAGIGIYGVISLLGLLIVWVLVGSGHPLSGIQQWREKNKRFLQFSGGTVLIALGFFVYVSTVAAEVAGTY